MAGPIAIDGHVQPHSHGPLVSQTKAPTQHATGAGPGPGGGLILPLDWVGLMAEDGQASVAGQLTDAVPVPADGGGWDAVGRPLRQALTIWRALQDAPALALEFLLDGLDGDRSVEPELKALDKLAGAWQGASRPEPPKLVLYGQALPPSVKGTSKRWVIPTPPTLQDPVIRRGDGQRIRQSVALTLWLYTTPGELQKVTPRKPAPSKGSYTVKSGDTYEKIAAAKLGSKRLGRKLAQFNKDRDPSAKLKAGRKIRLPSAKLLEQWKKDLKAGR